jgi:Co/Zn/Cd efflux system component
MISRTTFLVAKMDCPAEEQLVRMGLDGLNDIKQLDFDLVNRRLTVYHDGEGAVIEEALRSLNLGSELVSQETDVEFDTLGLPAGSVDEKRPLIAALGINLGLFFAEFLAGLLSGSMGLVADSLDMLADSIVYGLSLSAVGRSAQRKKRVARASGFFQLALAILGLFEVARRLIGSGAAPDVTTMIVVGFLALLGNVATLWILSKTKRDEAHMQASWIFTSNDIKVNALVILSGAVVYLTNSAIPDLLAGGLIFLIVANGARQILALSADSPDA